MADIIRVIPDHLHKCMDKEDLKVGLLFTMAAHPSATSYGDVRQANIKVKSEYEYMWR
jgi:hypothetical protein